MNPPLTPPGRGTDRTRTEACSPPGRGRGWVGSWKLETTAGPSPSVAPRIRSSIFPRSEMLGQGHRLEHRLGFVHRLLEFRFGLRIVHPSAADLDEGPALLDERGADGDAAIEIAVE